MERPIGLNIEQDRTVTKLELPQARGEGSGRSLASMSPLEIKGMTNSINDPLRGRFVQDGSPIADDMRRQQTDYVRREQAKHYGSGRHQTKNLSSNGELEPGHIVIHAERGRGVVSKFADGNRIEVIFGGGQVALVQTKKLKRAKH